VNEKYPVLYILHGGGEDETGWATQGKTDLILDNLIAAGKAKPMLIVMPDANIGPGGFSAAGIESSMKLFEREMKETIIPFVEKNYRTLTDANSRALAGLSLGGLHTLYTGINNTDKFSYLGVFSTGWIVPMMDDVSEKQYVFLKENEEMVNNNLKTFWISQGGKDDIAWKNGQVMLEKLNELKIKHTYSEYPGGHTWPVWRNNLFNFAQLLFK
jgi:enterochelin esterase-like enzyme